MQRKRPDPKALRNLSLCAGRDLISQARQHRPAIVPPVTLRSEVCPHYFPSTPSSETGALVLRHLNY